MTDIRAGDVDPIDDDGDRLPWLEAVEDDDDGDGPTAGKLIVFVLIGLVAIGLFIGGIFWLVNRGSSGGGGGAPELIAAPEGDYKVKPDQPGGMKVDGEGDTVFAASQGAETKGKIDVNAVPETPVAKASPEPKAAAPTPQAKAPPPAPAPGPAAAGGAAIQLGAFSSQASANAAWKALSGRFTYLAPLSPSVTPVTSGGRTLYRLRASGPGATDICGRPACRRRAMREDMTGARCRLGSMGLRAIT